MAATDDLLSALRARITSEAAAAAPAAAGMSQYAFVHREDHGVQDRWRVRITALGVDKLYDTLEDAQAAVVGALQPMGVSAADVLRPVPEGAGGAAAASARGGFVLVVNCQGCGALQSQDSADRAARLAAAKCNTSAATMFCLSCLDKLVVSEPKKPSTRAIRDAFTRAVSNPFWGVRCACCNPTLPPTPSPRPLPPSVSRSRTRAASPSAAGLTRRVRLALSSGTLGRTRRRS